ncbi:MAG: hypothetical protein JSS02_21600 [Planctomycetes bacterium]|nr:hypothetical protein [Planctomycetota bacterium]
MTRLAATLAKLRHQLLDARNSDGMAIYALATAGADDDSTVFRDARKWLPTSQQPDGSWLPPSKNITESTDPERLKVRDEIYNDWGTAWAALGLLETLGQSGFSWKACSPFARTQWNVRLDYLDEPVRPVK